MNYLLVFAIVLLFPPAGWSQGNLRFQTREFRPPIASQAAHHPRPAPQGARHYLVLFGSYPGPEVIETLTRRRIRVLSYVPDNALTVSAAALHLQGLDVQWYGPVDPADKISPLIQTQPAGAYVVIFQPDSDTQSNRQLIEEEGFTPIENSSLLPAHLLVSGAFSALPKLAELDEVAYILPASVELQGGQEMAGCAGALTHSGPAAAYVKASSGWAKDAAGGVNLHYFIQSVTPRVNETLARNEVARAFAEWERWANLTVAPASTAGAPRSIDVVFARWAHGDSYSFDGPAGALAHTFFPAPDSKEPVAGDVHLDADETWRAGASVDLFSVVLHEVGHSLGLAHSDNPGSVMYPYYRQQSGLTATDIAAIQSLYGKKSEAAPPATTTPPVTPTPVTTPPATNPTPVTTPGPNPDLVKPVLTVISPSSTMVSAYSATVNMSGTSSDNIGVVAVKWTTSTGGAGVATGTSTWSASIPLMVGDNVVTIRAYDAAGNSSGRAVTVVRH